MYQSIYSTGTFGMHGFQIDENSKIIKDGRVRFGGDFILDKGDSFEFIIQRLPVDEKTRVIKLQAKTQRSARMELNKMFPQLRSAYSKPDFVTIEKFNETIKKRDEAIKNGDGLY